RKGIGMALDMARTGFGIMGTIDQEIVRQLAPRVEAAGFRTLWFNQPGSGDALACMQTAAAVTSTLRLGSGVIAVDRNPVAGVIDDIRNRELPLDRCII